VAQLPGRLHPSGIAPCTAMVLVWGYLSRGNDGLTLVMVAINSLTMLLLYGVWADFCWEWGACRCPGRRCCCPSVFTSPCRWWPAIFPASGSLPPRGRHGSRKNFACAHPGYHHRAADHAGVVVFISKVR
jgi:hypothetical protein